IGKLGVAFPFLLSGAPYVYDAGHVLPNMQANYSVVVAKETLNEEKAVRLDGQDEPVQGEFWTFPLTLADGDKTAVRKVVVGKVGDAEVEQRIKDGKCAVVVAQKFMDTKEKSAAWSTGDPRPANGAMWIYTVRAQRENKTVV